MDLPHPDGSKAPEEFEGEHLDEFIRLLTESQSRLRGYLLVAMGNYDDASEVLQRTNLVLWRNARTFRRGADFMPWAVTLASFEIRSFYRDRGRDKLVFSEDTAEMLLQTATQQAPDVDGRMAALKQCVNQLPPASRGLIASRYEHRASFQQMAEEFGRTEGAIRTALARVRKALGDCVRDKVQAVT